MNGGKAGIIMPAHPGIGDQYFQEHASGIAEDQAQVLAFNGRAKTTFATFENCLLTNESSNLEPGVAEHKLYAAGIGEVKEFSTGGEEETLAAVAAGEGLVGRGVVQADSLGQEKVGNKQSALRN